MKKKVLNFEELFFPDMQESYTPEEFAKNSGWNIESVRQACRGQIDTHKRRAKLPEGFYAVEPRKNWTIKFKKPPFVHASRLDQRPIKDMENPLYVNSFDTFLDYDSDEVSSLNIHVVKLENTPKLLVYNVMDFLLASQPNKEISLYIGDVLIYRLVLDLVSKNRSNDIKVALPILTGWLDIANLHFSYHIRHAIRREPKYCLYCGQKLRDESIKDIECKLYSEIDSDISYMFRKYFFCSKTHKNNFDNPSKSGIIKTLIQFKSDSLFVKVKEGANKLFKLGSSVNSEMSILLENKRKSSKVGKAQSWSREYDLYKDLNRYFDFYNLEGLNLADITIQGFINKNFKGNKGTDKYTLEFLNDYDTTRLISKTMSMIRQKFE